MERGGEALARRTAENPVNLSPRVFEQARASEGLDIELGPISVAAIAGVLPGAVNRVLR